jgi:DNA repair protein RecO
MAQETNSIECVIIRTYPSKDADLVIRVIARGHGKLSLYARNTRGGGKKGRQKIPEVFNLATFEITAGKGDLYGIRAIPYLKSLEGISSDLAKLTAASVLVEAYDFLSLEHVPMESDLYDPLALSLQAISESLSLKDTLKSLHIGLGAVLAISGYDHTARTLPPSLNNLRTLIDTVEQRAEKQLVSAPSLLEFFEQVEKEHASERN